MGSSIEEEETFLELIKSANPNQFSGPRLFSIQCLRNNTFSFQQVNAAIYGMYIAYSSIVRGNGCEVLYFCHASYACFCRTAGNAMDIVDNSSIPQLVQC